MRKLQPHHRNTTRSLKQYSLPLTTGLPQRPKLVNRHPSRYRRNRQTRRLLITHIPGRLDQPSRREHTILLQHSLQWEPQSCRNGVLIHGPGHVSLAENGKHAVADLPLRVVAGRDNLAAHVGANDEGLAVLITARLDGLVVAVKAHCDCLMLATVPS